MNLPNEVAHGRPVSDLTQAVNALVRYCRSITPRPSASVGVRTLSNGTTFRVKEEAGGGGSVRAASGLNQFKVMCQADPEGNEGDWLVSVLGGTAQAMFGAITHVPDVANRQITIRKATLSQEPQGGSGGGADPAEAPQREYCFISAVYKIAEDGQYIHEFDEDLDFTVGETPPQSTVQRSYFPIAVVYDDGTVRQGHLGAIYVASMEDVVDTDDGPGEEEEEEEEE